MIERVRHNNGYTIFIHKVQEGGRLHSVDGLPREGHRVTSLPLVGTKTPREIAGTGTNLDIAEHLYTSWRELIAR